jgi:hypothetical protein
MYVWDVGRFLRYPYKVSFMNQNEATVKKNREKAATAAS